MFGVLLSAHWKSSRLIYPVLILIYLLLAAQGFGPYITDDHPFRQTQTAISTAYFSNIRDFFYYTTPILGPPWTIPFELPVYQSIVKVVAWASGLPLETCGRLVGMGFFLLCLWPAGRLMTQLGVQHKAVAVSLLLFTPLYTFWSRSFMIETTALFFSLLYLSLFIDLYRKDSIGVGDTTRLLAAGSLAALIKVTTLAPLFLATGLVVTIRLAYAAARHREYRKWLVLGLSHAVILLVTLAWIRHADSLKTLSPLGSLLTSANLHDWNYGPLTQRVDPQIWFRLINNSLDMFFPFPREYILLKLALSTFLLSVTIYAFAKSGMQRRLQALAMGCLFLLPFLIFTNLHRVHNYYQVSNGWLFILAIAVTLIGAYENAESLRQRTMVATLHLILLATLICCSLWYFHFKNTSFFQYAELADTIRRETPADSALIITGLDWSPEVPFYAQRRALMRMEGADSRAWEHALEDLHSSSVKVSAYIACTHSLPDAAVIRRFSLGKKESIDGCFLYRINVLDRSIKSYVIGSR